MSRPKYNDQVIILRVPATLARQARVKARQQRRPLSEVIRELLRVWLAGRTQPKDGSSRS